MKAAAPADIIGTGRHARRRSAAGIMQIFIRITGDVMFEFSENDTVGSYLTVVRPIAQHAGYETCLATWGEGHLLDLQILYSYLDDQDVRCRRDHINQRMAMLQIGNCSWSSWNMCRFFEPFDFEKNGRRYHCISVERPDWKSLRELVSEGLVIQTKELTALMEGLLTALDGMQLDVSRFISIAEKYKDWDDSEWCILPRQNLARMIYRMINTRVSVHPDGSRLIHNAVTAENILIDDSLCFRYLELTGFSSAMYENDVPEPVSCSGQDLYYAAPERFAGKAYVSSDIFSAGVLMYRLVFGTMPWETDLDGMTQEEQARAVEEKRRTPLIFPEKMLIDIDDRQLEAMKKALSVDPEKRFQSAPEFMDALGINVQPADSGDVLPDSACSQGSVPDEPAGEKHDEAPETAPEPHRARGNGFADVAGMEDLKSMMREKIIDVLKDPDLAEKYRIQIPNGMLLYGPPGCGKSFIAEKFAEEAGWNYKLIKSSDLASTYVHGSQEKIGQLFDEARKNAPMILNFDEFDALVPDRGRTGSAYMSGEVNEFLSQMNNCGKDRVFVIASSNRPDLIDPAVRRKGRLDQLIYIPVPDAAAREGMFRVQMKGRPQEEGIDFGHLASLTENYVAADIAFIVNDAAEKAFRSRTDITEKMLEDAIGRTRPSVGPDDIRYYESLRDKIEKSAKESAHNPIGFIQK